MKMLIDSQWVVPFNYPVELYAHKGAAAIAAGNAVITKAPSDCPLTLLNIAEFMEAAIQDAVESGAKLWIGGKRKQAFIEPTVLTDISPEIPLFRQEAFGPVVPLAPFDTEAEAISLANDSPYGLQAAVFTNDISRALDVAHKLEAGGVIVNWSSAVRVESLPFGGIKLSGHGREGLHDTLNDMTEQKTIIVHNALSACSSDD